ncbi:MAG: hypothetical protein JKY17_06540 [Magnetovibrio sp.]|nr:hypothetical protein [Magnetovibrio sp.]
MTRIEEIYGLLGSAVAQSIPSDDQIIMDNVKKAMDIAREEMRHQNSTLGIRRSRLGAIPVHGGIQQ